MAAGKDTSKPNIIMGANAQVALEKVCGCKLKRL